MAKKGTYSAYQQQPPVPSGQFAGVQAFNQMAAVEAQKRAEERQEQRRLRDAGRKAIANAVQAGNIDVTKINSSVHSMVSKVLDNYGDKVAQKTEEMEDDYSFSKQMELSQLQSEFQSKIGQLSGLGSTIQQYSKGIEEGEFDNILSAESANGLFEFVSNIPQYADNFDPENLAVNGKKITDFFNEKVNPSGFVARVNEVEKRNEFLDDILIEGGTETQHEGGREVKRTRKKYDPKNAKAQFYNKYKGSREAMKERVTILQEFEGLEGNEAEEFAARYLNIDDDGDVSVSLEGLYNYFDDNYIQPRLETVDSKPLPEDQPTQADRKAQKEALGLFNKVKYMHDTITPGTSEGLGGMEIAVAGEEGPIKRTEPIYNPVTGEHQVAVTYTVDSDDGKVEDRVVRFPANRAGMQQLGQAVFGMDYFTTVQQLQQEGYENLDAPQPQMNLQQRNSAIANFTKHIGNELSNRLSAIDQEVDAQDAKLRAFEFVKQNFDEVGEIKPLQYFANDFLNFEKGSAPAGVGSFKSQYNQELAKIDKDEHDPLAVGEELGEYVSMAQSLKAEGKSDDDIAKTLYYANQVKNGKSPKGREFKAIADMFEGDKFVYDRVQRYVKNHPGTEDEANSLVLSGLSDDEVISALKGQSTNPVSTLHNKGMSQDQINALSDKGVDLETFMQSIEGLSKEQIQNIDVNRINP